MCEPSNMPYWPWIGGLVLSDLFFSKGKKQNKIYSIDSKDKYQLYDPASVSCKDLYLMYFLTLLATLQFTCAIIYLLE